MIPRNDSMVSMGELELVLDSKSKLGEGPCWDVRRKLLIWVNILEKQVNEFNPVTKVNRVSTFEQYVGAVVPAEDGTLFLAMQDGIYHWNPLSETIERIGIPENHSSTNRFNDGKCDPAGRFWAGTLGMKEEKSGSLYRFDTDRTLHRMIGGITCSNGMAWSPDGKTMYYTDTPTFCIEAFDYDITSGDISNRRVVIQVPEHEGAPDGITIDEEGFLWVAHWRGGQVIRWNPHTGEAVQRILVPSSNTTSCTFGGEHLNELYITTGRVDIEPQELEKTPHAGGLFRVKLGVKGRQISYYKG